MAAVDPIKVAHQIEARVRDRLQGTQIDLRMIGLRKSWRDIADGALAVILFAVITLGLTLLAVWMYCQSLRIALVPVGARSSRSRATRTLVLLGYGIDPLGLLVPFLIFAIGSAMGPENQRHRRCGLCRPGYMGAARRTFRQLLMPAIIALLADLVGFITICSFPCR